MRPTIFICLLLFFYAFSSAAFGQIGRNDGWMRVQTDNGELSIEVPSQHSYFFDLDGFTVVDNFQDYPVREMRLLNAYHEGTLLSLEVYRAGSDAMTALMNATLERGFRKKKTRYRGIDVRELMGNDDNGSPDKFYLISRYFRSNEFVYIVTGLSRSGETPVMLRFFESIKFDPNGAKPTDGIKRMSELIVSPVDVKTVVAPPADRGQTPTPPIPAIPDPSYRPAILASKPLAAYTKTARHNNVQGALRLKPVLDVNGYIPAIDIVQTLPDGLVRQAIFAVLRLKFLPSERNGAPVKVKRTLEYVFSIY